ASFPLKQERRLGGAAFGTVARGRGSTSGARDGRESTTGSGTRLGALVRPEALPAGSCAGPKSSGRPRRASPFAGHRRRGRPKRQRVVVQRDPQGEAPRLHDSGNRAFRHERDGSDTTEIKERAKHGAKTRRSA